MAFDVEEIKRTADIVSVIGSYIALKKRGAEYIGLCPFHDDHNPSFMVNKQKGIATCFACNETYDVIDFIQTIDGVDFPTACERLGGSNSWTPMLSAPAAAPLPERITTKPPSDAPTPTMELSSLGKPIKTWELLDLDGSLICYEARYDDPKNKARMWSWGARPDQIPKWGCGHPNQPRPLYGLHRLRIFRDKDDIVDETKQVCITEGAKKADAAEFFLGEWFVCLSWTGGAGAMSRHDWSVIKDRPVLLWPDADHQIADSKQALKYGVNQGDPIPYHFQPGQKAMFELGKILTEQGCTVRIINVFGMDPSWDAADALEEEWDSERVVNWLQSRASDYVLAESETTPPNSGTKGHADETIPLPESLASAPPEKSRILKPPGTISVVTKKIRSTNMADIEMENVDWLWHHKIALGKITLIAGDPGLGKSQITAALCAVVTSGGKWPGDQTQCQMGSAVILSIEDDPKDTLKPRLVAAGADCSKIEHIESSMEMSKSGDFVNIPFSIKTDMEALKKFVNEIGDVKLVIVDPISAYLADVDTHNAQESRAALDPIKELGQDCSFATVLVSHLTKNSKAPFMTRVQGSVSFVAIARSVFGVIKDPEDPDLRYFLPGKNNLATDRQGLSFRIEGYTITQENPKQERNRHIETSRIMWNQDIIERSLDDYSQDGLSGGQEGGSTVANATEYLEECLEIGEQYGKGLIMHAEKEENFKEQTIRRAAAKLGIVMRRSGGGTGGKVMWSLPEEWFNKKKRIRGFSVEDTHD